jgi:hypothetical protein
VSGTVKVREALVRAFIGVLVLILTSSGSAVAQSRDAAYYCVAEASGGLKYNETTRKWEGASLRPEAKFVLRMNFLRARVQKEEYPSVVAEEKVNDYTVTVTTSGQNIGVDCISQYPSKTVTMYESGTFRCYTAEIEYVFNVRTNRFLAIHRVGYVNGEDKDDSTPSIQGGTCTKID